MEWVALLADLEGRGEMYHENPVGALTMHREPRLQGGTDAVRESRDGKRHKKHFLRVRARGCASFWQSPPTAWSFSQRHLRSLGV